MENNKLKWPFPIKLVPIYKEPPLNNIHMFYLLNINVNLSNMMIYDRLYHFKEGIK